MSLAKIYAREIHKNLLNYATWEPEKPIRLGDYGTLDGGLLKDGHLFSRSGSVQDRLGFEIVPRQGEARAMREYMSRGAVKVAVGAVGRASVGGADVARAEVNLSFSREGAVYMRLRECQSVLVENLDQLTRAVARIAESDGWGDDVYVVGEVLRAEDATVLVSSATGANVTLNAHGPGEVINLADASVSLSTGTSSQMGVHIVAAEGLTPMLRLMRLRRGLFSERAHLESKRLVDKPQGSEPEADEHCELLFVG